MKKLVTDEIDASTKNMVIGKNGVDDNFDVIEEQVKEEEFSEKNEN